MELKVLQQEFAVCKVKELSECDLRGEFCFVGKTDEELSLVCAVDRAPKETLEREDGWRAFRIQGVLDFSLVGILARISSLLAEKSVGIFAISTFNTDYILIKNQQFPKAIGALKEAGYHMIGDK